MTTPDITPNHPAVEAPARAWRVSDEAEIAASEAYAQGVGERPFSQRMRAAITAALPHLESATEENLARLRNTPVGRALMAESWDMGWAGGAYGKDRHDNPHREDN